MWLDSTSTPDLTLFLYVVVAVMSLNIVPTMEVMPPLRLLYSRRHRVAYDRSPEYR